MKKIKIKIGDEVKLFNGESGTVSGIDTAAYQIEIHAEHGYSRCTHILNIKYLNGIDCERNVKLYL